MNAKEFAQAAKTLLATVSPIFTQVDPGKPLVIWGERRPAMGNFAVVFYTAHYEDSNPRDERQFKQAWARVVAAVKKNVGPGVIQKTQNSWGNSTVTFLLSGSKRSSHSYISIGFDPDQVGISVELGAIQTPGADHSEYFGDMLPGVP